MKLNHPGIYRIIGEEFELVAIVIGEVPTLRITSAMLINDLVQKNKFTILSEESLEIQQVYANPDNFIFFEYEYSEIANLSSQYRSIRGTKMPDITDQLYNEFKDRYISDTSISGRGICATKAYIMQKTNWSIPQISVLLMKIAKEVKYYGTIRT